MLSPDTIKPSAMLATIKGLSRHKRLPPTSGGRATATTTKAASAPDAVPPIYSTIPLTVAARGARSEAVGTKGVPKPAPSGRFDLASGRSNKAQ